jgi:hypothetical protein
MAADWDTSGIHDRRVDERLAPEPRRSLLGGLQGGWLGGRLRGRRRTAGILTGLVSVAIIAGYIWSGSGGDEPEAGGEPPLIQADDAPIRVPPESPGGLEIPHRDKLVLQRVPGEGEDPRRERLLPPPEEPLPPPQEEPAAAYEPPPESLPPPVERERLGEQQPVPPPRADPGGSVRPPASATELAPRAAAPTPQKPAVKSEQAPPARTQPPPAQARSADGPTPLIPGAQQPAQQRSANAGAATGSGGTYVWPSEGGRSGNAPPAQSGSAGKPAPARPGETTTAYVLPPAATQPAPGGAGTFLVQLAAVSTAEQAQAAWSRLRGNNGDLLAGLSPSYARADLGTKGVVYRLRAGPVQGETRARALCAQLAGRKVDCMVVRAGG